MVCQGKEETGIKAQVEALIGMCHRFDPGDNPTFLVFLCAPDSRTES